MVTTLSSWSGYHLKKLEIKIPSSIRISFLFIAASRSYLFSQPPVIVLKRNMTVHKLKRASVHVQSKTSETMHRRWSLSLGPRRSESSSLQVRCCGGINAVLKCVYC